MILVLFLLIILGFIKISLAASINIDIIDSEIIEPYKAILILKGFLIFDGLIGILGGIYLYTTL